MAKGSEGLGLLIGMSPAKGAQKGEPEAGAGHDESTTMAAKALMRALKGDDPGRVASAFKEMLACCDDDYDVAEEAEPEDEE